MGIIYIYIYIWISVVVGVQSKKEATKEIVNANLCMQNWKSLVKQQPVDNENEGKALCEALLQVFSGNSI